MLVKWTIGSDILCVLKSVTTQQNRSIIHNNGIFRQFSLYRYPMSYPVDMLPSTEYMLRKYSAIYDLCWGHILIICLSNVSNRGTPQRNCCITCPHLKHWKSIVVTMPNFSSLVRNLALLQLSFFDEDSIMDQSSLSGANYHGRI